MNAGEVKSMLLHRLEDVCAHLLPNGKRKGNDWLVGSPNGEAGGSMHVHLAGDRLGGWKDFGGGEDDKGDVFNLWERCRGVDFPTALKEAKDWLGVVEDSANGFHQPERVKKTYVRPTMDEIDLLVSGGAVFDYLATARQLDPAVLHRYKVGQMQDSRDGPTVVFPCYEPAGKVVDLFKFLALRRQPDGKKIIRATTGAKPRLFGWQAIKPGERQVVITEGEIDCLTVAGWGHAALSLPSGVNNQDWIEHDFESLERFERIYLCTDMDTPGHKCAAEIAQRLGRERCYRVLLPDYKDVNEALCSGRFLGPDFDDCLENAKTLDPAELRNLGELMDEIWETFHPSNSRQIGTEPPFELDWRCRFGELSIWTGWSGAGKSHLLNQFLLHDAHQGENVCVASFEMPAGETGARLVQMMLGCAPAKDNRPSMAPAEAVLARRFWVVHHLGVMHWPKVIPILKYAARRYGCTRFAIDSLLRCGIAEDDYNTQKEFVNELVMFAAEYGHVHLVCHSRKATDEAKGPGKLDVRGAAAITDLCHNGFTVWRNKTKEQKVEEERSTSARAAELSKLYAMPDAQIAMWKNRKTGREPFRKLWLHHTSGQFSDRYNGKPFQYITL